MDPHNPQKYNKLNDMNDEKINKTEEAKEWSTYFCDKLLKIELTEEFNPSLAIGFLIKNRKELDYLVKALNQVILKLF